MNTLSLLFSCCFCLAVQAGEPVHIILDTDIASDCDDAGAVAMLNALADNGEAEILAMLVSTGGPYGAPALDAINAWYGRTSVPIGSLREPDFWSGGSPDKPSGAHNYASYSRTLAESYAKRFLPGSEVPDATTLYRSILATQPDGSVVISSIGPLINLHRLLDSAPDAISPLRGVELVRRKVQQLVIAGGRNPRGTSSNFSKSGAGPHARAVVAGWPGRVVFVGNEVGEGIRSGWDPADAATSGNPARRAYACFHGGDEAKERPSWDQAAVLYAVRGTMGLYGLVEDGHQEIDSEGRNAWMAGDAVGADHAYIERLPGIDDELRRTIVELMRQPRRASRPDPGSAGLLGMAPTRMILDMDMDSDCDDAGALGVLHALADHGEVVPLAIMISGVNAWSGPCADAINTAFGRPDLPIGTARSPAPDQASRYAQGVAERLPHRLQRSADAPDAVQLYREILAHEADATVTVVTIGDMTNLAKLLRTPGGPELVRAKVRVWVCMGGNFIGRPARDDLALGNNNFTLDPGSTYEAITRWPTPIVFVGREVCSVPSGVVSGAGLRILPADHPVRLAYALYFGGEPRNRHVADIVTVVAAVRGLGSLWDAVGAGGMDLQRDMTFVWDEQRPAKQAYLLKRAPDAQVEAELERLLVYRPVVR
jgi:inosine-uridine nucleoside N-ribohydrolase